MGAGSYTRSEVDLMINAMNPQEQYLPDRYVKPVPQFYSCLTILATFMKSSHQPIITVRSEKTMILIYSFVEVSGSSFVVLYCGTEKFVNVLAYGVVVKI